MFATEAATGGLLARILGQANINTTQAYLAVFDEVLVRTYRAFLDRRRATRPEAEYREPTQQEWTEFQQHFQTRKLELGECGRPYKHEHACIRCPSLRLAPSARPRLVEIVANLRDRIQEAQLNSWLGEVAGLQASLNEAARKLTSLDRARARGPADSSTWVYWSSPTRRSEELSRQARSASARPAPPPGDSGQPAELHDPTSCHAAGRRPQTNHSSTLAETMQIWEDPANDVWGTMTRTSLPVLSDVDLGAEFRALVDAVAALVPPQERRQRIEVLLDHLPDASARLDLVRLAVIVALEQKAESVNLLPVTDGDRYRIGTEWLIWRAEPAPGFAYRNGKEQPRERTVTLADGDDESVRVTVGGARIEVSPPSEQECIRLLESGVRGTTLRFPIFPSSGPSMLARGDGPRELVLWRCGTPAVKFRLPGPVLAAIYVSNSSHESLITLIEVDRELVVHIEGTQDTDVRKLHVPIDFSVADEAEHDLSPLYLDMDEAWRFGVYFRRAGVWWYLQWSAGDHIILKRSNAVVHQAGRWPFHTHTDGGGYTLLGADSWYADPPQHTWKTWRHGSTWKAWRHSRPDAFITVPPGEEVLGLTYIGDQPALLTRQGAAVRARTPEDVRTVVEFAGPVVRHDELPWVAVQRSAHLVEILDIATGTVLHRIGTEGETTAAPGRPHLD